jgi:crotonobetainyl-CoA:carnitine CoA-transferase CaiB-like acyl-CoA transferase
MNAWLATRTTEQAIVELEKARVPAGPVLDLQQVLDDPQVKARELLKYVDHPGAAKPVPLADTAGAVVDYTGWHSHASSGVGRAYG